MTTFKTEAQFEQAFVEVLTHKGWEPEILKHKTEAELLKNWADILMTGELTGNEFDMQGLSELTNLLKGE